MTSGIKTGAAGPPESVSRNRAEIPSKPDTEKWVRSLMGEISRVRSKDPELSILLQNMVQAFSDVIDTTWVAIDILDKRWNDFQAEEANVDTEFREIGRTTQQRRRVVEDDDSDIQITVVDIITQTVTLRGNKTKTKVTYVFNEPLPA